MFATDALPRSLIYISSRNGEDCLSIYSFGNKNVPSRGLNVLFLAPRTFVFDSDGGRGSQEKLIMWAALSDQRCWTRRDGDNIAETYMKRRVSPLQQTTLNRCHHTTKLHNDTYKYMLRSVPLTHTHTLRCEEMWGQRSELCWSAVQWT